MNKLVRYWNQNRGKIIITIAIIAFIIILIQIVNGILENSETERKEISTIDYTKPVQSVITGEIVSEEKTTENTNIIKEFVDYCNKKEYQKAYELLTKDCKKEFNNNINTFINNYYKKIFTTQKTYSLELWLNMDNSYTYKIKYYQDNLLETGASNLDENIEDYITIMKEDNEDRISINGFIKEKTINKSKKLNDIEIIVNSKKIYKNYETYDITIRNFSNKAILISDGNDNDDIYLLDSRNVKYSSFINEIPVDNLLLKSGYEKNISIRFNKMYTVYRNVEKIEFCNIILDEEKYMNTPNKENIETTKISIEL